MKTIKFFSQLKYAVLLLLAVLTATTVIAQTRGQNQQTPKDKNPLGVEIGGPGNMGAPRYNKPGIPDIGGTQSAPRPFILSCDIGGQRVSGDKSLLTDIGNNQDKPKEPKDNLPLGIGGQTAPRTGSFMFAFSEIIGIDALNKESSQAQFSSHQISLVTEPIGGAQTVPRQRDDIGGQTTPGSEVRNFAYSKVLEIGGGNTGTAPRFFAIADIGGQSVPRSGCGCPGVVIGGGSTAPRA